MIRRSHPRQVNGPASILAKTEKRVGCLPPCTELPKDLLNPGYRRLILNGIYWTVGLENEIKADSKIDFVGPYNPTKFEYRGEVKGVKPVMYADLNGPIPADPKAVVQKVQSVTAKNQNIRKGARYVRVEIADDNRILTLNEVEVISGGKNIAPKGKATQSSTGAGGVASEQSMAIKTPITTRVGKPTPMDLVPLILGGKLI